MHTKRALSKAFFIALYLFSTLTMAATPPLPCEPEANKQFDFWIGDWEPCCLPRGSHSGVNGR